MTTDWNLWKTGLMAMDGSMQLWRSRDGTERSQQALWHPWRAQVQCVCAPPEVQHRVGDRRGSVLEGLDDDGETFGQQNTF